MLKNKPRDIILGLLLFCSSALFAHGDLSIRIKEKTQEILIDSTNSRLFFERGFLYQQHFEFKKALSDYSRSEDLGNSDNLLNYRIAEVYSSMTDYSVALEYVNKYIKCDSLDVKAKKLKAQILMDLNRHPEALVNYDFVIKNTLDIRPEDIVEYSAIFLSIDSSNYAASINAIDWGLDKLGNHIIALRITKLDYLKKSHQSNRVIEEYNALIVENNRKEFWYYKKAVYLIDIDRLSESYIALQQAKASVEKLKPKIKNTSAIKDLVIQINEIEKSINHEI